jgi:hypothetical protein
MSNRELDHYFSPPKEIAESIEMDLQLGREMVAQWVGSLNQLVDELVAQGLVLPEAEVAVRKALETWGSEKPETIDHGGWHSYVVYRGMTWLAEQDGRQLNDALAQAAAVLHDLVQTLPWVDISTGRTLTGNQRRLHALAMAKIIQRLGSLLGFEPQQIKELSLAIRIHDDVYAGVKHDNLPYLAEVLSDADKLTGAVLPHGSVSEFCHEQLPDSIRMSVQRNANGGINYKGVGWFNLNAELTATQRERWEYGDRWNLDSISALRREFFGLQFYTPAAQDIGQHREGLALDLILEQAGQRYDEVAAWIAFAQETRQSEPATPLEYVALGFDRGAKIKETVPANVPLVTAIKLAYQRVLEVPPAVQKSGFVARGWKLAIAGRPDLLDPSIGRFVVDPELNGREGYLAAVTQALVNSE